MTCPFALIAWYFICHGGVFLQPCIHGLLFSKGHPVLSYVMFVGGNGGISVFFALGYGCCSCVCVHVSCLCLRFVLVNSDKL